ncbi:hypothetical protein OIU77_026896 [Salix suchowensis]|uniref:RRM domain-containing protein n=1 Tax=Salix suchowensis TaxID=1278906 RepID=A0ABQ9BQG5_9ROSI|nr:hypothetical protein OIU77_026896 [Salix suchowensis]
MRTADGKSRQFAFVGFRTEHEAEEAIRYFNKSYLDTCRIVCEIARKVGDPDIPRPWSRYSKKIEEKLSEDENNVAGVKSLDVKGAKDEKKNKYNEKGNEIDDPRLQEFLQVMQPRAKSKLWENDSIVVHTADLNGEVGKKASKGKKEGKEKSVPVEVEIDKGNSDTDEESNDLARDEAVSDMDYFRSRRGNVAQAEVAEDTHAEDLENPSSTFKDEKEEILETGRLFVRNLPYTAIEDELEEHFSKFGNISQVHLVVDKDTKRSKGLAYIHYTVPESAARALEELDNSIFQGRLLHVMPAKQKILSNKQETSDLLSQGSKTLKQRRQEEKKAAEASGDTRAWNSLFFHHDTVIENIARRHGVSKSDLLDREADDLAVRVALGETQVIAETKKALTNAGVNITALEEIAAGKKDGMKRSNHVLLVKNLSYGSSEVELAEKFGKFGSLDKIILPPTKTLALVVFLEPSEARAAFKGLAYKQYKGVPLYLEWAPDNILSQSSISKSDEKVDAAVGEHDAKRVILEQSVEGISEMDIDPDRIESRSLFVKNLNFKTADETLKKHFSEHMKEGRIQSVRIKKHMKKGKNVSMGFGFIEFDSVETATNICRDLQGTVLDGHALILQLSFEATEKDLRQLFSPFGQIKSLRLPMKFENHRGFAFVEYVTKQEAQNAIQALSNTHLYGRHLVLERAKEGESLEELRARTAAQFTEDQNGFQNPAKLSKKRKDITTLDEVSMKFQRVTD